MIIEFEELLLFFIPWYVASHLNTLIPVGIAIIIVAEVKYARVSTSNPTVNIWWARTMNPRNPMPDIALITPILPNVSLFYLFHYK